MEKHTSTEGKDNDRAFLLQKKCKQTHKPTRGVTALKYQKDEDLKMSSLEILKNRFLG